MRNAASTKTSFDTSSGQPAEGWQATFGTDRKALVSAMAALVQGDLGASNRPAGNTERRGRGAAVLLGIRSLCGSFGCCELFGQKRDSAAGQLWSLATAGEAWRRRGGWPERLQRAANRWLADEAQWDPQRQEATEPPQVQASPAAAPTPNHAQLRLRIAGPACQHQPSWQRGSPCMCLPHCAAPSRQPHIQLAQSPRQSTGGTRTSIGLTD